MEVVVYTRPGDEQGRRIKEILSDKGVDFREYVFPGGKLNGELRALDIGVSQLPLTVVDGVAIQGLNRPRIEQAIGWVGS